MGEETIFCQGGRPLVQSSPVLSFPVESQGSRCADMTTAESYGAREWDAGHHEVVLMLDWTPIVPIFLEQPWNLEGEFFCSDLMPNLGQLSIIPADLCNPIVNFQFFWEHCLGERNAANCQPLHLLCPLAPLPSQTHCTRVLDLLILQHNPKYPCTK